MSELQRSHLIFNKNKKCDSLFTLRIYVYLFTLYLHSEFIRLSGNSARNRKHVIAFAIFFFFRFHSSSSSKHQELAISYFFFLHRKIRVMPRMLTSVELHLMTSMDNDSNYLSNNLKMSLSYHFRTKTAIFTISINLKLFILLFVYNGHWTLPSDSVAY